MGANICIHAPEKLGKDGINDVRAGASRSCEISTVALDGPVQLEKATVVSTKATPDLGNYDDLEDDIRPTNERMATSLGVPNMAKDNLKAPTGAHAKVPLSPGRGLLDWLKYSGGKDLSGTGGQLRKVDENELAKHNTLDDCWILIQDRVYNVTAYMEYHPGGELEMMRGSGTDGTQLFDEIHPWVNFESMLKSCLVGQFTGNRSKLRPARKALDVESVSSSSSTGSSASRKMVELGISLKAQSSTVLRLLTKWKGLDRENVALMEWSPPKTFRLGIMPPGERLVSIFWRSVSEGINVSELSVLVQSEDSGVISVTGGSNFGEQLAKDGAVDCVRIESGNLIDRPYTPVLESLTDSSYTKSLEHTDSIYFLIKLYKDGRFTGQLSQLKEGDALHVSDPTGTFSRGPDLHSFTHVCLLAAGTGLTPMMKLIKRRVDTGQVCENDHSTALLFFNRTEKDIIACDELNELAKGKLLTLVNILSNASPDWKGPTGRISAQLLKRLLPNRDIVKSIFIGVCGPDPFTDTTVRILQDLGYDGSSVHVFQG